MKSLLLFVTVDDQSPIANLARISSENNEKERKKYSGKNTLALANNKQRLTIIHPPVVVGWPLALSRPLLRTIEYPKVSYFNLILRSMQLAG